MGACVCVCVSLAKLASSRLRCCERASLAEAEMSSERCLRTTAVDTCG